MDNHWLITKHSSNIEMTVMSSKEFRWKINNETEFGMDPSENPYNSVFDWDKIIPKYAFFYNYEGIEDVLHKLLQKSSLIEHRTLLVETAPSLPVIKVSTDYFLQNAIDFIDANQGLGSIVITEDMELLMEFTDDHRYYLLSNFAI